MNRKRREFFQRNTDPRIRDYVFGQGHCCDIPDGNLITEFEYYPYKQSVKNKLVDGIMLLPRSNGEWSEDKLWLSSFQDAEFFVRWYNENHKAEAILIEQD